jgi:hypothetical protein
MSRLIGSNAVTNPYTVFAPCGHHEKNAALNCRAKVEITFLSFDDLHSQVHRSLRMTCSASPGKTL